MDIGTTIRQVIRVTTNSKRYYLTLLFDRGTFNNENLNELLAFAKLVTQYSTISCDVVCIMSL